MDVYRLVEDEVDIPTLAMEVVRGNRKGKPHVAFFLLILSSSIIQIIKLLHQIKPCGEKRLSQICILNITRHESTDGQKFHLGPLI